MEGCVQFLSLICLNTDYCQINGMHHGACCFRHSPDFTDCADYMPGDAKLFCVWTIARLCTVRFQIAVFCTVRFQIAHWGIAQLTLCYKTLASLVSSAILTTHAKNWTHLCGIEENRVLIIWDDCDIIFVWKIFFLQNIHLRHI